MAWAKYVLDKDQQDRPTVVVKALVTDGGSCYYCFRGWHTIYKSRFTLTQYRGEVFHVVPLLVAAVVSSLARSVRLS